MLIAGCGKTQLKALEVLRGCLLSKSERSSKKGWKVSKQSFLKGVYLLLQGKIRLLSPASQELVGRQCFESTCPKGSHQVQ